ncbi:helix-turn-helix transcriptional regulator [Streptomyces sp. NRRL S-1521]|uniref:helix-turn-helix transcriptional regulator n=1 Tax=Streptomyces sp. NRRL S-1521 TaxID=1609100 RepID=UPI0007488287|nr:helix-turn-helix transcriptional regulator [Streptomyces sp. NRRL S-1521]KUL49233.1 PadR family transcriptional regulator [Streptomyces sp. NRRL S-1521]
MPPVFAHGRLRLYLLKLLDEAPRHGYEVIRLLEERFHGLYAPSAGTVYPRLAKLEAEGLVRHTTEGGRKVYAITDAGRAELAARSGELADLELEIRESVAELAAEIRDGVQGVAGDLRREMRAAAKEARGASGAAAGAFPDASDFLDAAWGDKDGWQQAKEEFKRAKQEWKEQARRAKDESRRARDEAQRARREAKEAQDRARTLAQEEVQRIARRIREQVEGHYPREEWPTGVEEGLTKLAKEFGQFGMDLGKEFGVWPGSRTSGSRSEPKDADATRDPAEPKGADGAQGRAEPEDTAGAAPTDAGPEAEAGPTPDAGREAEATFSTAPDDVPAGYAPDWAKEDPTGDPARDLDRLLDRFRDDIRDAARDHGVTSDQFRDARRHLSTAAAHIGAALRTPKP